MKNVKTKLSVLLLFILTLAVQAQTNEPQIDQEKNELTTKELEEAKSRFAALRDSPNYRKMERLYDTLSKNQDKCSLPDFDDDSSFIPWIKENLHLSEFKSVEEAVAIRNERLEIGKKVNNQDPRLNDLMKKASQEQGIEIVRYI